MKPKHGVAILFVVGKMLWPATWASWWWLVPILLPIPFCAALIIATVAVSYPFVAVMEAE